MSLILVKHSHWKCFVTHTFAFEWQFSNYFFLFQRYWTWNKIKKIVVENNQTDFILYWTKTKNVLQDSFLYFSGIRFVVNFFKFLFGKFSNWIQLSKKWETIKRRDTLHNEKKLTPDTQRTFNLNNAPKPTDSNSNVQKPTQRTVATYGSSMWVSVCAFAVRNVHTIHDTYAESTTARPRSHASFLSVSFIRSFIFSISLDLFCRLSCALTLFLSVYRFTVCACVLLLWLFSHVNTSNHVYNS